jgi:hypothetical protein
MYLIRCVWQGLVAAFERLQEPEVVAEEKRPAGGKKDKTRTIARSNEGCYRTTVSVVDHT